jgi:hypothetical protein
MYSSRKVRIQRTAPIDKVPGFHEQYPWEVVRPLTEGAPNTRFSWHTSHADALVAASFYVIARQITDDAELEIEDPEDPKAGNPSNDRQVA